MPLAIELAAARTRVLSVQQIADHLHERFRLLASGGRQSTRRHQSLQAAIDWSYNLLDTDEQALMRRLSVFVSSFSLKGAAAVYADNTSEMDVLVMLDRLVDKSLVMAEQGPDEKRYRMLETIKLLRLGAVAGYWGGSTYQGEICRILQWPSQCGQQGQ